MRSGEFRGKGRVRKIEGSGKEWRAGRWTYEGSVRTRLRRGKEW